MLILAACAQAAGGAPGAPASAWTLTYQRSGGLAGRTAFLTLSSSGDMEVQSLDQTTRNTLPQDELESIAAQLDLVCAAASGRGSGTCADCFAYSLMLQRGGRTCRVQLSDADLAASGLGPLLGELNGLLRRATSQP